MTSVIFQIWNLKTYKLHTDLPGHTDEVYCVDFVADKIVSAGRDTTVKMCVISLSSWKSEHCVLTKTASKLEALGLMPGCLASQR